MLPKVSVVIPTYKRAGELLERAIKSVLEQTYMNIELVVIDDNIPDSEFRKATEIFMEKCIHDSRVLYVKNDSNLGGALARNIGIEKSQGDYITFLDDDDIYLPNKIEKQLSFMLNNDYDMTFTDLMIHNSNGHLVDYREYTYIKEYSNQALLKHHIMRHITGTPTFMYKRDALINIGGFVDCKMGQEFYLMFNSIDKNLKIGYYPFADVIAYLHEGEKISKGHNKLEGESMLYQFKKKYFGRFRCREKMFIRFRHHVVMSVTGLRSRMYFVFIKHAFLALILSPIDAIIEPFSYMKRINLNKASSCSPNL